MLNNCDCNIPNCQTNLSCEELIRQKSDAPTIILTLLFLLITYIYSLLEQF